MRCVYAPRQQMEQDIGLHTTPAMTQEMVHAPRQQMTQEMVHAPMTTNSQEMVYAQRQQMSQEMVHVPRQQMSQQVGDGQETKHLSQVEESDRSPLEDHRAPRWRANGNRAPDTSSSSTKCTRRRRENPFLQCRAPQRLASKQITGPTERLDCPGRIENSTAQNGRRKIRLSSKSRASIKSRRKSDPHLVLDDVVKDAINRMSDELDNDVIDKVCVLVKNRGALLVIAVPEAPHVIEASDTRPVRDTAHKIPSAPCELIRESKGEPAKVSKKDHCSFGCSTSSSSMEQESFETKQNFMYWVDVNGDHPQQMMDHHAANEQTASALRILHEQSATPAAKGHPRSGGSCSSGCRLYDEYYATTLINSIRFNSKLPMVEEAVGKRHEVGPRYHTLTYMGGGAFANSIHRSMFDGTDLVQIVEDSSAQRRPCVLLLISFVAMIKIHSFGKRYPPRSEAIKPFAQQHLRFGRSATLARQVRVTDPQHDCTGYLTEYVATR
ncbi:unnamed protein product, partial [Mesorhabditis belari]|uniref:Uncharacterized protein n=1 Tax=Mesorhabditis belari TaxID=2138241 RepID=A0AAF3EED3_9BILA